MQFKWCWCWCPWLWPSTNPRHYKNVLDLCWWCLWPRGEQLWHGMDLVKRDQTLLFNQRAKFDSCRLLASDLNSYSTQKANSCIEAVRSTEAAATVTVWKTIRLLSPNLFTDISKQSKHTTLQTDFMNTDCWDAYSSILSYFIEFKF